VVVLLLERGVFTPLMIATMRGHVGVMRALLVIAHRHSHRDQLGALRVGGYSSEGAARLLLQAGAD
jgi:hypothetical protein